ncbi:hypothetical protein HrrHm2_065 [Halorubrum virus Humcor2]|nr:antitoxin VapB family protein [Halorubrum coriense]QRG24104.1 hypothetical protein HrrHm2_065 [Halorubrum virus Humcor2]
MGEQKTTVTVSRDTWKKLQMRKEPGDSFDDVISDLIEEVENSENE